MDENRFVQPMQETETVRRQLFMNLKIPVVILDPVTWKFIDCNPKAVEFYGYTNRNDVLGKTPLDVSAPFQYDGSSSEEAVKRHIDTILNSDSEIFEWKHLRPNGEIWDAEVHLMKVQIGSRFLIQLTLQDISQRRKTEEALRESEKKFRTLFESAGDAIFLMEDSRFIDCNRRTLDIFGCSAREEIIGSSPSDFSPRLQPDGQISEKRAKEKIKAVLKGQAQSFEWTHCKLNGDVFPTVVSLNRVQLKGRYYIQAIVHDLSDQNKALAEHERMLALLETSLIQSTSGILIADAPDGTIRWANPAAFHIRGQSSTQMSGEEVHHHAATWQTYRTDGTLLDEKDLPLSRAVQKGEVIRNEEMIIRDEQGEDHWVLAQAAPVRDRGG